MSERHVVWALETGSPKVEKNWDTKAVNRLVWAVWAIKWAGLSGLEKQRARKILVKGRRWIAQFLESRPKDAPHKAQRACLKGWSNVKVTSQRHRHNSIRIIHAPSTNIIYDGGAVQWRLYLISSLSFIPNNNVKLTKQIIAHNCISRQSSDRLNNLTNNVTSDVISDVFKDVISEMKVSSIKR